VRALHPRRHVTAPVTRVGDRRERAPRPRPYRFQRPHADPHTDRQLGEESRSASQSLSTRTKFGDQQYTGNKFDKSRSDEGIFVQTTTRYTPKKIGVAEGYNRTLGAWVTAVLEDSNLPRK